VVLDHAAPRAFSKHSTALPPRLLREQRSEQRSGKSGNGDPHVPSQPYRGGDLSCAPLVATAAAAAPRLLLLLLSNPAVDPSAAGGGGGEAHAPNELLPDRRHEGGLPVAVAIAAVEPEGRFVFVFAAVG
jgi:hypothetical protein